jgi:SM-20-related protein
LGLARTDQAAANVIVPALIGLSFVALAANARRRAKSVAAAIVPARLIRIPHFLGPYRNAQILASTVARDRDLQPSTVTGNVDGYRSSRVLWQGGEIAPDVAARVHALAPAIGQALGVPSFPVGAIENQITVSKNGDFFKKHDDNSSPDTAARRISWVYYVHREPRPFVGGELMMYNAPGGGAYVIQPQNDMLVCFPSGVKHEVKPVYSSSDPHDARITVNGWIREA